MGPQAKRLEDGRNGFYARVSRGSQHTDTLILALKALLRVWHQNSDRVSFCCFKPGV